jgi:hypothetical protein
MVRFRPERARRRGLGPLRSRDWDSRHARRVRRLPDPCLDAYPMAGYGRGSRSGRRLVGFNVNSFADRPLCRGTPPHNCEYSAYAA